MPVYSSSITKQHDGNTDYNTDDSIPCAKLLLSLQQQPPSLLGHIKAHGNLLYNKCMCSQETSAGRSPENGVGLSQPQHIHHPKLKWRSVLGHPSFLESSPPSLKAQL